MANQPDATPEDTSPASSSSASTQAAAPASSAPLASPPGTAEDMSIWPQVFSTAMRQAVVRAASARRPYPSQIDFSLTYADGTVVKFVGMRLSNGMVEVWPE